MQMQVGDKYIRYRLGHLFEKSDELKEYKDFYELMTITKVNTKSFRTDLHYNLQTKLDETWEKFDGDLDTLKKKLIAKAIKYLVYENNYRSYDNNYREFLNNLTEEEKSEVLFRIEMACKVKAEKYKNEMFKTIKGRIKFD